jgi:PTS system nitrogen regulatory IIA component
MKPPKLPADLLNESQILLGVGALTKSALLTTLAQRASKVTGIGEPAIAAALTARETLGSTGFGGGIAMPHARIDGLPAMFALFARLDKPVPFEAIDGKPVDLVVMLLSPRAGDADHLAVLAAFSRRLRDQSVAGALRAVATAASARELLIG